MNYLSTGYKPTEEQQSIFKKVQTGKSLTITSFEHHAAIRHVIGIDPGNHTGLAVYSRDDHAIIYAAETTFSGAIAYITSHYDRAIIVIETPSNKRVWHGGANQAARDATAINVGMVIREAQLFAQMLEYLGRKNERHYVIKTPPPQRGLTKLTREQVRKITGYDERSNGHVRDAIMLCWGV